MNADLPRSVETVVVGAGQAGLTMSWFLREAGREHVVLDRRDRLGGGWQDRWDGFRLVSPNWITSLPGFDYDGDDPDGYMPRDAVVDRMARYAAVIDAPVRLGTTIRRLSPLDGGARRFRLDTDSGSIDTRDVVVATGGFHQPRIPTISVRISPRVRQLHSHDYRRPSDLPPGRVLVVGTGQTGVQLTEELREAGYEVILSVGHCGRVPRRYRGHDMFWWLRRLAEESAAGRRGLPSVDQLPDPRARRACNPHVSGHHGGHDTNLRKFAADGVRLVGRLDAADGERVRFASGLEDNLRFADDFFADRFQALCEAYIERMALDVPPDDREPFVYPVPEVAELDLAAEGVSSVLWTSGYGLDFGWIELPIFDEMGFPRTTRGVSEVPGLSFLGLLWQFNQASGNLSGLALDARYLAERW
ncbi:MAG TPA: NAD(P)-binding domain-containing protein [Candidatus Limnocylindrales bacterium]|nr:NAD(P)-binding domain-containing protein [Candidatus Limnocylindrales bacterium]